MGKLLSFFGIVFILIVLVLVGAGVYFYNFHVFKTLRICVADEAIDSNFSCSTQDDCLKEASLLKESDEFKELPDFIKDKFEEASREIIVCEQTCKVKKMYTNFYEEGSKEFDSCAEGEKEISVELHGKEGLKLFGYFKNLKDNTS